MFRCRAFQPDPAFETGFRSSGQAARCLTNTANLHLREAFPSVSCPRAGLHVKMVLIPKSHGAAKSAVREISNDRKSPPFSHAGPHNQTLRSVPIGASFGADQSIELSPSALVLRPFRHETRGRKDPVSIPRISYDAHASLPYRNHFAVGFSDISVRENQSPGIGSGKALRSAITQTVGTEADTNQKASNRNGKTIITQSLSPPPEQSSVGRWESQQQPQSQPGRPEPQLFRWQRPQ